MFDGGWKSFLLKSCLLPVISEKPWIDIKTIFSICWKKFGWNSKAPDEFLSAPPGWEMTLNIPQIDNKVPDSLLWPSIMWRVLLYWAGIDRNLHSIGKRNDHGPMQCECSQFLLFSLLQCTLLLLWYFYHFIEAVMESISRVSDNNGPWMSAWRLRLLRLWHQAGCEANVKA